MRCCTRHPNSRYTASFSLIFRRCRTRREYRFHHANKAPVSYGARAAMFSKEELKTTRNSKRTRILRPFVRLLRPFVLERCRHVLVEIGRPVRLPYLLPTSSSFSFLALFFVSFCGNAAFSNFCLRLKFENTLDSFLGRCCCCSGSSIWCAFARSQNEQTRRKK